MSEDEESECSVDIDGNNNDDNKADGVEVKENNGKGQSQVKRSPEEKDTSRFEPVEKKLCVDSEN